MDGRPYNVRFNSPHTRNSWTNHVFYIILSWDATIVYPKPKITNYTSEKMIWYVLLIRYLFINNCYIIHIEHTTKFFFAMYQQPLTYVKSPPSDDDSNTVCIYTNNANSLNGVTQVSWEMLRAIQSNFWITETRGEWTPSQHNIINCVVVIITIIIIIIIIIAAGRAPLENDRLLSVKFDRIGLE